MEDSASSSDADEAGSHSTQNNDYDLRMFGISRALPVPEGVPDFDAGPPQTAEEYLQWVRHEAMQCPQVMRVEISPEKLVGTGQADDNLSYIHGLGQSRSLPQCPDWAQPSGSWVREFLLDFRRLREQLVELSEEHQDELGRVRLPATRDMQAWGLICFGPGGDDNNVVAAEPQQPVVLVGAQESMPAGLQLEAGIFERISGPLLKTVMALDQVRVVSLVTWLVDEMQSLPVISYSRSQWLFSLTAVLEKPIHCDTGACLRSLLRKCCVLRSASLDKHDPRLPTLNTLIAVAGGYFGQDESLSKLVASEDLP